MLSGVSGEGRTEALREIAKLVAASRGEAVTEEQDEEEAEWQP